MRAVLAGPELDLRAYVAQMAEQAATARANQLYSASVAVCGTASSSTGLAAAAEVALAAQEWLGIVKACQRERARLARIKHGPQPDVKLDAATQRQHSAALSVIPQPRAPEPMA